MTATEFAGGRFLAGGPTPPGMAAHRPEYVGRVMRRAPRPGEPGIDIPQRSRAGWRGGDPGVLRNAADRLVAGGSGPSARRPFPHYQG
jgi:hypothetical protein